MWKKTNLPLLCALALTAGAEHAFASEGKLPAAALQAVSARIRLDLGHQGKLQLRRSALSAGLKSSSWLHTAGGPTPGRAYVVNAKAINHGPWGKTKGTYLVVETQQPNDALAWEAFPLTLHQRSDGSISKSRVRVVDRGKAGGREIQAQLYADGALGPTKVVGAFVAKNTAEAYGFNETGTIAQRDSTPGAQGAKRRMTLYLLGSPTEQGAAIQAALYGGPVPLFNRGPVAAPPAPGVMQPRPPLHPDWVPSFIKAQVEAMAWAQGQGN
jgi:hypothetical protein